MARVRVSDGWAENFKSISRTDIDKLVDMCEIFALKKVIGQETYAYYVPRFSSFIEPVKKVFVTNGLPAQVNGDALWVSYSQSENPQKLLNVMIQIKREKDAQIR